MIKSQTKVCYSQFLCAMINQREEKKLVKEVQAGSQEAFGRLYDTYIDSIYRFIYLKTSSKEDAQDLTSQVFLRVWERLNPGVAMFTSRSDRGLPPTPRLRRTRKSATPAATSSKGIKNFRAFLYQIARNLVIDHWRGKGGEVLGREADVAETAAIIEDKDQNLEEKFKLASDVNQVKEALEKVKGDYKDVIIWYYLDELSIPEIAQILGKSGGAVRVMVHRGLKEARKWLK